MTAIQIDISEDISRLDIPSKADAKTLTLMRVGAMRGISFYISPAGQPLNESTNGTSVTNISDLITLRSFIDETIEKEKGQRI